MSRLEARSIGLAFGEAVILEKVDLVIEGGITLLAGRNGAGKTTLLSLLAGIRRPDSGEVLLDGKPVRTLPGHQRARSMTLIPQEADSSFEFTGREIVMMGRHPHIGRLGGPKAEDHRAVEEALEITDSGHFADRSVCTLSGGELRRISIARALATNAEVILADEPTSNLDLEHAVAILELLQSLAGEGRTILVTSHDLNLIAPRCDSVAILHEGRIWRMGRPEEVLGPEDLAQVFGVKSSAPRGYFPRWFEPL